jgi:hypothetical protein
MKLSVIAETENLNEIFKKEACSCISALTRFIPQSELTIRTFQSLLLAESVLERAAQNLMRKNHDCDKVLYKKIRSLLIKITKRKIGEIDHPCKQMALVLARTLQRKNLDDSSELGLLMNILTAFSNVSGHDARSIIGDLFDWNELEISRCEKYIRKTTVFVEPMQDDFFFEAAAEANADNGKGKRNLRIH